MQPGTKLAPVLGQGQGYEKLATESLNIMLMHIKGILNPVCFQIFVLVLISFVTLGSLLNLSDLSASQHFIEVMTVSPHPGYYND